MVGEWEDVGGSAFASPACTEPSTGYAVPSGSLLTSSDIAKAEASTGSVAEFLEENGLGNFADKIIEVTDAESVQDLKLLDVALVEEVIVSADLKLLSAKKFRLAIAELRGEAALPGSASPTSQAVVGGNPTQPSAGPSATATQLSVPQECVAVCIDRSGSMGTPFAEVTLNIVKGTTKDSIAQRTRMEAVKAMFYAFRDRVENVGNGTHHLGLLQFDNNVEQLLDLTPRLDRFEAIVDDMEKRGQTAIYSSIIAASHMLEKHFHEDSQTDLRVLVLTDGQSNTGAPPQDALEAANKIGAVVDAIIVGDRPDSNLRKIVNATGGECYQINDLGEGFELLEAEGVVSLRARRGDVDKPRFERRASIDFGGISEKQLTRGTAVQRAPPALAESYAKKQCVDVASLSDATVDAQVKSGNGACLKRVLKELKQISSGADGIWLHSGEGVHVFPAEDMVSFWRVLIEGPSGSPFHGGVFALNVVIPDNYPFQAPKITFETPIYHCNMSDTGKICMEILQDKWAPSLSVPKCLEAIRMLMKEPDTDNSLRQWIADLTIAYRKYTGTATPDDRYLEKAQECTRQHASMTVEEWKAKWNC